MKTIRALCAYCVVFVLTHEGHSVAAMTRDNVRWELLGLLCLREGEGCRGGEGGRAGGTTCGERVGGARGGGQHRR